MKYLFSLLLLAAFSASGQVLSDGSSTRGWSFSDGGEFPGAKGKLSSNGSAILLESDFSGGGSYVAAMYSGAMPIVPALFRYELETAAPTVVTIRVVDGNARTFQSSGFPLKAGKQQLEVALDQIKWANSWPAGTSDPALTEMVFPLQRIDLCIPRGKDPRGTVAVDSLESESIPPGEAFSITDFRLVGKLKPGEINEVEFTAGAGATLLLRAMIGDFPLDAKSQKIVTAKPGVNRVGLPLPLHLGSSEKYRFELCDPSTGKAVAAAPFRIAGATAPAAPELANASLTPDGVKAEVNAPAGGVLMAQLWIDGRLYAVEQRDFPAGAGKLDLPFSESWKRLAAGRAASIRVMAAPGGRESKNAEFSVTAPGTAVKLPKPMNCGVFTDRFGIAHPWHMNHRSEYIFDGKRYFPVGGMWCPKFTFPGRNRTDAQEQERLEYDLKVLGQIKSGGLNDVYFNSGLGRIHQLQYFIDLMEQNGIEYGMQNSAGYQVPEGLYIDSFFLRKDHLTEGVYRNGQLELNLPKEQKAVGFLLLAEGNADRCHFVPFHDTVGNAERELIFDLDTGKDLSQLRGVRVPAKLPVADGTRFTVIPKLSAKMTHFNFWNPELRRKLEERQAWIKSIEWGPGFRYLIDPVTNETHMLLDTENLRQHTPDINADFAQWLRERYHSVDALAEAWGADPGSFETASRLVPQRSGDRLLLLDPERGDLYRAPLATSRMHLDYNEMIRETYSRYVDGFARYLKSMVNVPVLDKNVGAYGSPLHVSREYCGVDGAGFEVYLNQGLPQENNGGATRAAADASPHTVWKVGTELGHSAAIGNDGVPFFRNEAEMRSLTDGLSSLGVNGFLFFGFELQPIDRWSNHSYNRYPEGMQWAQRAERDYTARRRAVTPRAYLFPADPCNVGRAGISRYNALYDNTASAFRLSARIRGDEWAALTEVLPEQIDRLFLNLPHAPFSLHYAPEAARGMERAEEVYYLGGRDDLGSFPEIDRYFTRERITFADNSSAQVLNAPAGAEVLAAENGKPWAIRHGKLVIVSREPVLMANNRGTSGFRYLEQKWIPKRNYFLSGDPVILGAIETAQLGLITNSVAANQVPAGKAADFTLPVTVRNLTSRPEEFELAVDLPETVKLLESPEPFQVEPGASRTVVFRVDLTEALRRDNTMELTVSEKHKKFEPLTLPLARRQWAAATIPATAHLAEAPWIEFPGLSWIATAVKVPNIKAKFRAGYETATLVIEVEVEDPVHHRTRDAAQLWMFDSIQLAFSPLRDGEIPGGDFAEIGAGDSGNGPVCFAYSALAGGKTGVLTASRVAFRHENQRSFYRIELDANELNIPELKPGRGLAFSILVNSNDGTGRSGYLHWGDGIGSGKNPQEFNLLNFR